MRDARIMIVATVLLGACGGRVEQADHGGLDPDARGAVRNSAQPAPPDAGTAAARCLADEPRWREAAPMPESRSSHRAVLLGDGRVALVGGYANADRATFGGPLPILLYDAAADTWTTGPMPEVGRTGLSATVLADGRVLLVGGFGRELGGKIIAGLAVVEIFAPRNNQITSVARAPHGRYAHAAALLRDGRVLVAGGYSTDVGVAYADVYDPVHDAWTSLAQPEALAGYAAGADDRGNGALVYGARGAFRWTPAEGWAALEGANLALSNVQVDSTGAAVFFGQLTGSTTVFTLGIDRVNQLSGEGAELRQSYPPQSASSSAYMQAPALAIPTCQGAVLYSGGFPDEKSAHPYAVAFTSNGPPKDVALIITVAGAAAAPLRDGFLMTGLWEADGGARAVRRARFE